MYGGSTTAPPPPPPRATSPERLRAVHAEAMTVWADKESLLEQWHNLLCAVDPQHPQ